MPAPLSRDDSQAVGKQIWCYHPTSSIPIISKQPHHHNHGFGFSVTVLQCPDRGAAKHECQAAGSVGEGTAGVVLLLHTIVFVTGTTGLEQARSAHDK